MDKNHLDYLIIGPAYPFRGGIADTQHELAKALQKKGKKIELLTFTKLYPKVFFPGKTQLSDQTRPEKLIITQQIHAYNPTKWTSTIRYICSRSPKVVVFRYHTPFLALSYAWIARNLPNSIKKVAIVDNWIPHETSWIDKKLNLLFSKYLDCISSLSLFVANQIKDNFDGPVWAGFHPINSNLLPILDKKQARLKLNWDIDVPYVLFFGLIRKYKGLELLIKAFNEAPLIDKNIKLYIAGECYEDKKKYTEIIEKLNLGNRVILDFNFKNKTDIQLLFSACDIVAQTYHKATQSGVTPLAYYYQKPLLVSDIESLKAVIVSDRTGITVKKDSKSIAAGIYKILDKNNINNFSKNMRKTSIKYNWSTFSEQWDSFVSEV
ncbi:MAG: glycosyltransferase [Flavobacteriaceae bacterium]